jgi:hypothetical protein
MCLIKMQGVHTTLQTNHEHHFSQTRLLFTAGEALYLPRGNGGGACPKPKVCGLVFVRESNVQGVSASLLPSRPRDGASWPGTSGRIQGQGATRGCVLLLIKRKRRKPGKENKGRRPPEDTPSRILAAYGVRSRP